MARLPPDASKLLASARRHVAFRRPFPARLPRALDRLDDDAPRLRRIAPFADAHPLVLFEVLIMGEEMLNLLQHDRGKVLPDRKSTRLNSSHSSISYAVFCLKKKKKKKNAINN